MRLSGAATNSLLTFSSTRLFMHAVQALEIELNREPCASQGWARRCNRGRMLHLVTGRKAGKTQS
ncbi:hypothetical protein DESC_590108 [Desulfosarcina cetonica]|nr:hypothetical protein DESC_590108 [Desulfosarcina cetonica]